MNLLKLFILLMFASYSQAQTSTAKHCNVKYNGVDPTIDQHVIEMQKEALFIFTPDAFKSMLVEYPLVEGEAALIATGGFTYFEMALKVNSARARKDYGYIEKGNLVKFFLMDGTTFYSNSLGTAMPKLAQDRKSTDYVVSCILEKEEIKLLNKSYIDRIGIIWSKGYEEYEIYNPDFFINQLSCIEE